MNPLCTSFPFAPRRIARSRAARWLVGVLALVLIAANVAAVAMPAYAASVVVDGDHAAMGHASSHAHCAGHVHSPSKNAGHGVDCRCCVCKACACVQACNIPAGVAMTSPIAPSPREFRNGAPRAYAAIEQRLLRPPIA